MIWKLTAAFRTSSTFSRDDDIRTFSSLSCDDTFKLSSTIELDHFKESKGGLDGNEAVTGIWSSSSKTCSPAWPVGQAFSFATDLSTHYDNDLSEPDAVRNPWAIQSSGSHPEASRSDFALARATPASKEEDVIRKVFIANVKKRAEAAHISLVPHSRRSDSRQKASFRAATTRGTQPLFGRPSREAEKDAVVAQFQEQILRAKQRA